MKKQHEIVFLASGTVVNATQEMLTLGLCNILGSLFSSMPSTGAFTRSAVLSASGVQTPMAGVYVGNIFISNGGDVCQESGGT